MWQNSPHSTVVQSLYPPTPAALSLGSHLYTQGTGHLQDATWAKVDKTHPWLTLFTEGQGRHSAKVYTRGAQPEAQGRDAQTLGFLPPLAQQGGQGSVA